MNSKQFGILIILVVVLGGAGLWIYRSQNDTSGAGDPTLGQKLVAQLPVNDVAMMTIQEGTNSLTLAKKNDTWRVAQRGDYPANYNEIRDFLLKLRDLKVLETEKVGPSDLAELSLAKGNGTNAPIEVEFKDKDNKTLQTLLLGKKHMRKSNSPSPMGMGDAGWPDGRYVATKSGADSVMLISDPLTSIEPRPEQWLDKDFFKVEKVRMLEVTFPENTNSWKLTRETESGEWKLADAKEGEALDSTKTSSLSSPLSSPSFNDVSVGATPESLGMDRATNITIGTFDNLTYTIKVGSKQGDNYPMTVTVVADLPKERTPGKDEKPEDKERLDKAFKEDQKKLEEKVAKEKAYDKWTYLVSSWTLEPVLKTRAELLVEKKKEEPPAGESDTNAVPEAASEPK